MSRCSVFWMQMPVLLGLALAGCSAVKTGGPNQYDFFTLHSDKPAIPGTDKIGKMWSGLAKGKTSAAGRPWALGGWVWERAPPTPSPRKTRWLWPA